MLKFYCNFELKFKGKLWSKIDGGYSSEGERCTQIIGLVDDFSVVSMATVVEEIIQELSKEVEKDTAMKRGISDVIGSETGPSVDFVNS